MSITRRLGLQIVAYLYNTLCAINSSENVRTGATCIQSTAVSSQSKVWNKTEQNVSTQAGRLPALYVVVSAWNIQGCKVMHRNDKEQGGWTVADFQEG